MFREMLQVFLADVAKVDLAKVDLDVAILHMCIARVASVLSESCIFHREFECVKQRETYVATGLHLIFDG
jgi:hypothetical protein